MAFSVLFLDDDSERTKRLLAEVPSAKCVETAQDCIDELERQPWDLVLLDHDLGGEVYVDSGREDCGMEVVRWVAQNQPKVDQFIVHTHNPSAAAYMNDDLEKAGYSVIASPFCYMIGKIALHVKARAHVKETPPG